MKGVLANFWLGYARSLQLATAAPDDAALGAARAHANRLSRSFFSAVQVATGKDKLDLAELERLIAQDHELAGLWSEYNQALEMLGRLESGSQAVARAWQATSPAEHFFAEHQELQFHFAEFQRFRVQKVPDESHHLHFLAPQNHRRQLPTAEGRVSVVDLIELQRLNQSIQHLLGCV